MTKPIDFPVALARIGTHLSHKRVDRKPPRKRGALRARGARRQRRAVGLEPVDERGVLVAAMEGDARLRRTSEIGTSPDEWLNRAAPRRLAARAAGHRRRTSPAATGTSKASTGFAIATARIAGCSAAAAAIRNGDGVATRFAGSLTDITEAKLADRADGTAKSRAVPRSRSTARSSRTRATSDYQFRARWCSGSTGSRR